MIMAVMIGSNLFGYKKSLIRLTECALISFLDQPWLLLSSWLYAAKLNLGKPMVLWPAPLNVFPNGRGPRMCTD